MGLELRRRLFGPATESDRTQSRARDLLKGECFKYPPRTIGDIAPAVTNLGAPRADRQFSKARHRRGPSAGKKDVFVVRPSADGPCCPGGMQYLVKRIVC
jgi:hypothetical protein